MSKDLAQIDIYRSSCGCYMYYLTSTKAFLRVRYTFVFILNGYRVQKKLQRKRQENCNESARRKLIFGQGGI